MADLQLLAWGNLQVFIWFTLAVVVLLGLVALISPARFAIIANRGSKWIDTNKFVEFFDRRIEIDRYVLRYTRTFGIVVLAAAALLAYVLGR